MGTTKPYLTNLHNSPEQTPYVLEWTEFLGGTFGASGALNALQYYELLGWITPRVRRQMAEYLQGLSTGELHTKKYDEPAAVELPLESLSGTPFGVHARSLAYVAAIAGDNLGSELAAVQVAESRIEERGRAERREESASKRDGVARSVPIEED
ncbi:FlaD/FlaE family flagellar protein [Halomarina pelagica]|uniref:FlaD/FlaE family flagellar protein n=1 Tax=Halomarina pelagica TaxID=2961599 RepID=UPI0020C4CAF5|nr:FlaD/FlaE family flagellar protein [Halomarina sp. BND7]